MAERLAYLEAIVGADITQFRRGMAEIRNETGLLSERSRGISAMGRRMTYTLAAPLVAVGGLAASVYGEFDENMRNINAIARMSEADLSSLSQATLEWGKNTRSGAVEASNALYTIYSAGVTNKDEAMRIMQASTMTAEAGLADLETTTEALTATLLAYGDKSESATSRASNAITAMVALGVGEMETFASSMSKPLTTAAVLGVKVEDLFNTLAFLTQRGESPAKAATQTYRLLAGMIKPSIAMQSAFAKLGVKNAKDLVSEYGTLQKAILAVVGTTDGSLEKINKLWVNTLGARGITTLISDIDGWNESITDFNKLLPDATKAAHEEQMKSFTAQVGLFKSALGATAIVIGEKLVPHISDFLNKMTTFLIKITDADPKLVNMGVAFAGIVVAVSPLLWILPTLLNPVTLLVTGLGILAAAFATDFKDIRTTVKTKVEAITGELTPLVDSLKDLWNILFPKTEGEVSEDKSILDMLGLSRPTSEQMKEVFTPETPVSLWSLFEGSIAQDEGFSWHWFMKAAAKAGWTGGAIPAGQTLVIEYDGLEIDIADNDIDLAAGKGSFSELYGYMDTIEGAGWTDPPNFGERLKLALSTVAPEIKDHLKKIWDNVLTYLKTEARDDISDWWVELKTNVTATWEDHKPAIKARFDLIRARWNRFFRDGTAPYEHGTETSDISQIWSRLKESVTATWEDHKPAIKARFDLIRARWNRFFRDGTAPYEHGTETSDISKIWSRLKESVTATWEDHKPAIKARFDLIRARWNRFFRDGTAPYEHGTETSDISKIWSRLKESVTATWEDHKPAIKARFDLIRARWNRFFRDGTAPYEHGTETSDISKIWSRLKESVTATWEDHKPAIKARFDLIRARWNRFFRDGTAPYEHGTETSDISQIWSRLKESVTATWEDHKPAIKARFDLIRARWNRFFRDGTAPYEHGTERSGISKIWTRLKNEITETWEEHKPAIKARIVTIGKSIGDFFTGGDAAPYMHEDNRSPFQKAFDSITTGIGDWYVKNSPTILTKITTIATGIKDHLGSETNIATIAEGAAILLTDGFAVFSTLNTWFATTFPNLHADLSLIAKSIGDWFKDSGGEKVAYGIGYFVGTVGVKISQGLRTLSSLFTGSNLTKFLSASEAGIESFGSGFNDALANAGVEDLSFADKLFTGIAGVLVTYTIASALFAPVGTKIVGAIVGSIGFQAAARVIGTTVMSMRIVQMVSSGLLGLGSGIYNTLLAPAAGYIVSHLGVSISLKTGLFTGIATIIVAALNTAFVAGTVVAGAFSSAAGFIMMGITDDLNVNALNAPNTRAAISTVFNTAFEGAKAAAGKFKAAGIWVRDGISTAVMTGGFKLGGLKSKLSTAISAALGTTAGQLGVAAAKAGGRILGSALATGAMAATALAPAAIAIGVITLAVGAVKFVSDEDFRDSVHHAILKVLSGRDFKVPMSVSADVKTKVDFEEAGYDPEAFDSFTMSKWLVNEIQKDYMKDWVLDLDIPGINYSWQSDIPIDIPDAPQTVKDKILASWKESFGDTNPLTILSDWHDDLITFEAHAVAVSDLLGFDPNDLDAEAVIAIEAITNMADAQALLMDKVISSDITGEEFVTTYLAPIDLAWVGMYGAEGTMTAAYSGFVTGLVTDTTTLSTTMDTFNTDASADVLAFKASAVPDFKKVGTAVSGVKTEVDELSTSLSNLDGIEVSFKVIVNKIEVEPEGSFAKGLGYVPHDNYRANLHKGEMILPRDDAESYRRGQGAGVTNIYNTIEVHAESADDILRELDRRGIYVN